jgi:hypothetical protein
MVSGMQVTLIVDGRSVCFNVHTMQQIDRFMHDGGSLGQLLRHIAAMADRKMKPGEIVNIQIGGAGGLVESGIITPREGNG